MNPIRVLIEANRRGAKAIERRLPYTKTLVEDYALTVARAMNASEGLVVDVGGGRRCAFAKHRQNAAKIVAVDISAEELAHNQDVDDRIVADATERLPFASDSVEIVCSRSVVEHLANVDGFLAETQRVLRPGGMVVCLFPSKNAPYALVKRALPHGIGRKLLYLIKPGSRGFLGFRTYYDQCTLRAMKRALARHGFEVVDTRVSYYQADYFEFLLPLYLINVVYELIVRRARSTQLAACVLIVARKKQSEAGSRELRDLTEAAKTPVLT
jgi:ubiquinone/menaquinone biosynthesis C-methylase UbiE